MAHLMNVWILKSIVVVHFATALRVLPHPSRLNEQPQASNAPSDVRRTNMIEKLLLETFNQDKKKAVEHAKPQSIRPPETVRQAAISSHVLAKQQVEEQELDKVARHNPKSELLGKPYVETKGRNDYLVIQSHSLDPFVTVIPNSIYYDVEKKCVNWLDACSLKGIREHLLQRVQDASAQ
ncbi:uncharacterized protein LOC125241476 [Leguminivora glycinivorella]|uniref:uncharacterized protein LOC125241476 n=1 Tax=Leguminivora glycinivorella TaxID=1035111 RepID=UPI00200FEC4F|nr:uncharacterized protein LOC125241476 [Leguminivora glycinivorella]